MTKCKFCDNDATREARIEDARTYTPVCEMCFGKRLWIMHGWRPIQDVKE